MCHVRIMTGDVRRRRRPDRMPDRRVAVLFVNFETRGAVGWAVADFFETSNERPSSIHPYFRSDPAVEGLLSLLSLPPAVLSRRPPTDAVL